MFVRSVHDHHNEDNKIMYSIILNTPKQIVSKFISNPIPNPFLNFIF